MSIICPHVVRSKRAHNNISSYMKSIFDLMRSDAGPVAAGAEVAPNSYPHDENLALVEPYVLSTDAEGKLLRHDFSFPFAEKVAHLPNAPELSMALLGMITSSEVIERLYCEFDTVRLIDVDLGDQETTVGQRIRFLTDGEMLLAWLCEDDFSGRVFNPDEVDEVDLGSVESVASYIVLSIPTDQSNHELLRTAEKAKAITSLVNTQIKRAFPLEIKFDVNRILPP